jgi:hypothetical protein
MADETAASGGVPALRASDADREHTADILRDAAGEGRLTVDELDDRLTEAYGARTRAELELLVADVLPTGSQRWSPAPATAVARGAGEQGVVVREGPGGANWLVAVMSGVERKGRWRLARSCTALNLMGGSELDLNDVELADRTVELRMISIMGGGEIRLPEGVNVEVSDFGFMGGNSIDIGDHHPVPGGPTIRLQLVSIMGGADVKRGRKRNKRQERIERREARRLERPRGPHDLHH